jgi:SAM-dependent methyltransferase
MSLAAAGLPSRTAMLLPSAMIVSSVRWHGRLFDAAAMYDEDYLYFFAVPGDLSEFAGHGPVIPGADVQGEVVAELAWRLLDLRPGMSVLDLACGHGDLASRLAARGCRVTGYGEDARPLTADHKRMVIIADLP